MSKTHHVKLHTRYVECVESRLKTAEVRYNDRDYLTGDWLVLEEWDGKEYTGRAIVRQAKLVCPLDDIGLIGWVLICME